MNGRLVAVAAIAVSFCAPAAARAQYAGRELPRGGTVEVGAAAMWTGGRNFGSVTATETSNPAVSPNPLTLFRADSHLKSGIGLAGHVGVYLSPAFEVEGSASYSRPVLSVRLSADLEGAPDTIAEETLTHYVIGGSTLYHFGRGRLKPFVFGGAAYVRQLDAGAVDVQNGTELHAGGGIKYWFGRGRRRSGLRVDARISSRNRSAGLDTTTRTTLPVLSAGFAVLF